MTKSEKCIPVFERGIYCDSITFWYEEIDRVTITESKSLVSIHVDRIRVAKCTHDKSRFADSCVSLRNELSVRCPVLVAIYIELDFAFRCTCRCTATAVEHFITSDDGKSQSSQLFCHQDTLYQLYLEHKYWLPPAPLTQQVSTIVLPVCLLFALDMVLVLSALPNISRSEEALVTWLGKWRWSIVSKKQIVNMQCYQIGPHMRKKHDTSWHNI